ncbi:hypothetical protein [Streptomyces sp. B21-102]|uniref:hypothetical protein n=1 Tax=Streptomyces sp. B21-102 TaxID=3039416 RepID=UPI003FA6ADD7
MGPAASATAEGAIEYPTPEEARAHPWHDEDRPLVPDRRDTQFVGSPGLVADQLEQRAGGHGRGRVAHHDDHPRPQDRVRSYELLAEEWSRLGHSFQSS